jgi:hypothetical protein
VTAQAGQSPTHHIELASRRIVEYLVEAWTPIAALGTADASVVILLDHQPVSPLGNLPQGGDTWFSMVCLSVETRT